MIAVIPAAGLGTRLLPTTKSVPKELHPVRGKPAIQWVLEEAVQAGLDEFIVVTSSHKFALKHYLTPLGRRHPLSGHPEMENLDRLLRDIKINFVDQATPNGLGYALLACRKHIGNRPFALLLPDNVFAPGSQILPKLLKVWRQHAISCVVLRRARMAKCAGFVTKPMDEMLHEVTRVVPRDHPEASIMEIRNIGRSVLDPSAIMYLDRAEPVTEMDEVPALAGLAEEGRLLGFFADEEVVHLGETLPLADHAHQRN